MIINHVPRMQRYEGLFTVRAVKKLLLSALRHIFMPILYIVPASAASASMSEQSQWQHGVG
jgi:hypothetical protein